MSTIIEWADLQATYYVSIIQWRLLVASSTLWYQHNQRSSRGHPTPIRQRDASINDAIFDPTLEQTGRWWSTPVNFGVWSDDTALLPLPVHDYNEANCREPLRL